MVEISALVGAALCREHSCDTDHADLVAAFPGIAYHHKKLGRPSGYLGCAISPRTYNHKIKDMLSKQNNAPAPSANDYDQDTQDILDRKSVV